jgi:hypothetical protein
MLNNKKTSYQTKISCIRVLKIIPQKLKGFAELVIGFYQSEIIYTLQNACKDRIHKVQLAANEALREWIELEEIYAEIERKKTQLSRKIKLTQLEWKIFQRKISLFLKKIMNLRIK